MMSLWCDLTEISGLMRTKGRAPLSGELNPESSPLAVLLDLSLARSVAVHAVHLEVSFAVTFDQRSGEESHEGDGEELSQRPPGEDVVQGMDL